MTPITHSFQYGQHTVTLETGVIARQATAAVIASMDDTSVMVTVVGKKEAKADQDFFPLTVNYQEKAYAAGKIPGGFFKRKELLTLSLDILGLNRFQFRIQGFEFGFGHVES